MSVQCIYVACSRCGLYDNCKIKTMFHYLNKLLFSNAEEEDVEMAEVGDDPVEGGTPSYSEDSNSESDADEEETSSDDSSEYFPDSESEEELCCKAGLSKLILYGTDHTLKAMWGLIKDDCKEKGVKVVPTYVSRCLKDDGIECECNTTANDKGQKFERKLSSSV